MLGYTGDKAPPFLMPARVMEEGVFSLNPQFEWTGGGLISTTEDLAKWSKLLYDGKVFSDKALNALLQTVHPRTGEPFDQGYGLGVQVRISRAGPKIYGHEGVFPGYQTAVSYLPGHKCGMALQVNADMFSRKINRPMPALVDALLPVLLEYLEKRN